MTCSTLRLVLCREFGFGIVVTGISPVRVQDQNGALLPKAKEIVERYDKALGREAALRRHTSSTMRGTVGDPGSHAGLHLLR